MTVNLFEVAFTWLARDDDPDPAVAKAVDIGLQHGPGRCSDHVLEPFSPPEIRPVRDDGIERQALVGDHEGGRLETISGREIRTAAAGVSTAPCTPPSFDLSTNRSTRGNFGSSRAFATVADSRMTAGRSASSDGIMTFAFLQR